MKKCNKHSQYFPDEDPWLPATTEYFHRYPSSGNRLEHVCKKCYREIDRRHYRKHYNTLRGRLYQKYTDLNFRCNNPKSPAYKDYGGRGIQNLFPSFDAFFSYITNDLGITKFSQIDGLQIDRINNNGNYEPGNIRFVTAHVNMVNRSRDRVIINWKIPIINLFILLYKKKV